MQRRLFERQDMLHAADAINNVGEQSGIMKYSDGRLMPPALHANRYIQLLKRLTRSARFVDP
jgi:hypothetical protein